MRSCQQKIVRKGLESYLRYEASLVLVKLWVSFVYQENFNRLLFLRKHAVGFFSSKYDQQPSSSLLHAFLKNVR